MLLRPRSDNGLAWLSFRCVDPTIPRVLVLTPEPAGFLRRRCEVVVDVPAVSSDSDKGVISGVERFPTLETKTFFTNHFASFSL